MANPCPSLPHAYFRAAPPHCLRSRLPLSSISKGKWPAERHRHPPISRPLDAPFPVQRRKRAALHETAPRHREAGPGREGAAAGCPGEGIAAVLDHGTMETAP